MLCRRVSSLRPPSTATSMSTEIPVLNTLSRITDLAQCKIWTARHVVDTWGLQPTYRAGNVRVFSDADTEFIIAQVKRIKAERACVDGNY